MEFYLYLLLITLLIGCIWTEKVVPRASIFIASFFFLIVNRWTGLSVDLIHFGSWMSSSELSPYHLKEIMYWALSRIGYIVSFENIPLAYLLIDLFSVAALFSLCRNYKNGFIVFFLVFLSFPFQFGIQHLYRQFIGEVFLLMTLMSRGGFTSLILGSSAVLSHNSMLFYIPVVVLFKIRKFSVGLQISVSIFFSIVMHASLYYYVNHYSGILAKSNASTGEDMSFFYILYFCIIFLLIAINFKIRMRLSYISVWLYVFCLGLSSHFLLNSTPSERFSMVSILVLLVFLLCSDSGFRSRAEEKIQMTALSILLCIPMILFPNARQFL